MAKDVHFTKLTKGFPQQNFVLYGDGLVGVEPQPKDSTIHCATITAAMHCTSIEQLTMHVPNLNLPAGATYR